MDVTENYFFVYIRTSLLLELLFKMLSILAILANSF